MPSRYTQHPDGSSHSNWREAFAACGARTLVTANPGCHLQWEAGLKRAGVEGRVVHLAELVDHALLTREP